MGDSSERIRVHDQLRFVFPSPEFARIFLDAFMPEVPTMPLKRTRIDVGIDPASPAEVRFTVDADDVVAFRATINSFLQFANVVEGTVQLVTDARSASP